jgi:site-specific DNA-cytosine methylase
MTTHVFRAGFLFCGLGAGARGFLDATARLGQHDARFESVGGIDLDPLACADFETRTGSKATCADVATAQPSDLRAAWGEQAPDAVFLSAPCKGFSGLLPRKTAETAKYQQMNRLALQGMHLLCAAWASPPGLLVLENVPRIQSRGAVLLEQIRAVLRAHGYLLHEASHDCGEIGGLAQHRKRYLLVARQPAVVPAFVYRPPIRRVRACGEVLGELPLPEDSAAGPLHRLPRLSRLNWVRLALIPAGGDWRDLPRGDLAENDQRHEAKYRVTPWADASHAVTGARPVTSGGPSVADPRVPLGETAAGWKGRPGLLGVIDWDLPAATVAGAARAAAGSVPASVADPRLARGIGDRTRGGALGVIPWDEACPTITGQTRPAQSNTPSSVADPRLFSPVAEGQPRRAVFARHGVQAWGEPAATVAGSGSNGPTAVADPRVALEHEPRRGSFGVVDWAAPAPTVRGRSDVRTGPASVADERLPLGCSPRAGAYGVLDWTDPAATVTGSARIDNGGAAVADPRLPPGYQRLTLTEALARISEGRPPPGLVPVIASPQDGTWHRPTTTLELAALQGLPAQLAGAPLALVGRSVASWRERIGNAVPVGAGQAIGESMLLALLSARLGTWTLGSTGIWVRRELRAQEPRPASIPALKSDVGVQPVPGARR